MTSANLSITQSVMDQVDSSLDKYLSFVNTQSEFHKRQSENFGKNPYRKLKHSETAAMFDGLASFLRQQDEKLKSNSAEHTSQTSATTVKPQQLRLSLTPDDIAGLPEELLAELSYSSTDRNEFAILTLLNEAPHKVLSLDQIIVGLYRTTGEVHKRQTVTSRLYRMGQKSLVFNVPGKKGVYSLNTMTREEAESLFGDTQDDE